MRGGHTSTRASGEKKKQDGALSPLFSLALTFNASAARLRSRMPSSAPATRAMNFLVSRPREVSYRQPPGWGVGAAAGAVGEGKGCEVA